MTTVSSIIVEIKALGADFSSAWQGYTARIKAFNEEIKNGNEAMTKMAELFGALIGFRELNEAVAAADDLHVALAQLDQVLKSTGQNSAGAREELLALADAQEELTGVQNDQIVSAEALLLSLGATVQEVKQLTPFVLDVAR